MPRVIRCIDNDDRRRQRGINKVAERVLASPYYPKYQMLSHLHRHLASVPRLQYVPDARRRPCRL